MAKRRKGKQAVARKTVRVAPTNQQALDRAQARASERAARKVPAKPARTGVSGPTFAVGALVAIVLVGGFLYFNRDQASNDDPTPTAASIDAGTQSATSPGTSAMVDGKACWDTPPDMSTGYPQWSQAPNMVIDPARTYMATITTSAGAMQVELDPALAPATVNNFVCLAASGYYTNVPFHRILTGFMVQTGDPTGTGRGGPGYQFPDELPTGEPYTRGTLAMANAGPNTNGSQFFILHQDRPTTTLPLSYSVFGHVTGGLEVLDALAATPVGQSATGENSSPTTPVSISSVMVDVPVSPVGTPAGTPVGTPAGTPAGTPDAIEPSTPVAATDGTPTGLVVDVGSPVATPGATPVAP